MIMDLRKFIADVYEIELEYYDQGVHTDNIKASEIYDFKNYVREFKQNNPEYKDTDDCTFTLAANIRFNRTYYDEYIEKIEIELDEKITSDITALNEFYKEYEPGDVYVQGQIEVESINFASNELELLGKNVVDKLASILVTLINAYGVFYYEDLEDFYNTNDVTNETSKQKAVESHLHWLKQFVAIYGDYNNIFKFEVPDIVSYGVVGDYEFDIYDVEEALED